MEPQAARARRMQPWLGRLKQPGWAIATYLACVCAVWAAIHVGGDRSWLPTVMMFGPKWPYAAPIPVLLTWMIAVRSRPRSWMLLVVSLFILLFPIGGFCLPRKLLTHNAPPELRLLSFNAGGGHFDGNRFKSLLARSAPDVVLIQENGDALDQAFDETWNVERAGNLLIASRHPLRAGGTVKRRAANRWPRPICLEADINLGDHTIHVFNVHLYSPRIGLANVTSSRTILAPSRRTALLAEIEIRSDEHRRVKDFVREASGDVVVAGDFNTPTSSAIYRRYWTNFKNAFSTVGIGFGHTVWVEQGGISFSSRIDQILSSQNLSPIRSWVGPDVVSDHRPLLADFRVVGSN